MTACEKLAMYVPKLGSTTVHSLPAMSGRCATCSTQDVMQQDVIVSSMPMIESDSVPQGLTVVQPIVCHVRPLGDLCSGQGAMQQSVLACDIL
jgi:hypothetical protein